MAAITGLLLLSSCSGSRFGEQLSSSFSTPTTPAVPAKTAGEPVKTTENKPPAPDPKTATELARKQPLAKPAQKTLPGPATATAGLPTPAPVAPAPYRVTIKLPSADPSAPAEVLTRALRAAGLSFEVETIERVRTTGETAPR